MSDNDWKSRLGVVFSTNENFEYAADKEDVQDEIPRSKQNLRISLDKRNRGGKKVTLVADFRGSSDSLKELCKMLKNRCGVGGSTKEGEIIIQGDFREKIAEILRAEGYKARII